MAQKSQNLEMTQTYHIVRSHKTEWDWVVDLEVVESVDMKWSDFVKFAKKKYDVIRLAKRQFTIFVR